MARPEADAPITAWARDTSWISAFLSANAGKSQNRGGDGGGRDGEDMVRVAVRLRPMMPAEIEIGEEQVVRVAGRGVELDLGAKAGKMRFTFDNTFDSSAVDRPATQQDVFEVRGVGRCARCAAANVGVAGGAAGVGFACLGSRRVLDAGAWLGRRLA